MHIITAGIRELDKTYRNCLYYEGSKGDSSFLQSFIIVRGGHNEELDSLQ